MKLVNGVWQLGVWEIAQTYDLSLPDMSMGTVNRMFYQLHGPSIIYQPALSTTIVAASCCGKIPSPIIFPVSITLNIAYKHP